MSTTSLTLTFKFDDSPEGLTAEKVEAIVGKPPTALMLSGWTKDEDTLSLEFGPSGFSPVTRALVTLLHLTGSPHLQMIDAILKADDEKLAQFRLFWGGEA